MSSAPQVSVVIPTRSRWPLLSEALSSALTQDDVEVEVIVVDDGSTDETPQRLAELSDPRLRVLRHETRRGVAASRNAGLAAARSPWVAFLDDDDVWAPFKLRVQLNAAARSRASFAYGAAVVLNELRGGHEIVPAPDPADVRRGLLARNVIPGGGSNLVARTDVVRRLGGFDEQLSTTADWELWLRLAHAVPGAACPEIVVAYRRHRHSMVARGDDDVLSELDHLASKHSELHDRFGVRPDRHEIYNYFAGAQRRSGRRLRAAALYLRAGLSGRAPTDFARAVGVLLGERTMAMGSQVLQRRRPRPVVVELPSWLADR